MATLATNPERFHQRYESGLLVSPHAPRLTTRASIAAFPPRDEGLDLLLINAPIREWSYPNIMPIGQGYVGAVAVMDGHRLDVLDLNADRRTPVKDPGPVFDAWVVQQVEARLQQRKPDVIGLGGIVTQYKRLKQIAAVCKRVYPDVPIVLGGGIASCMPEFMLRRMAIDIAVTEEGEVTISELLHRLEIGAPLSGLLGVAYRDATGGGDPRIVNNGLRPSMRSRQFGLDGVPWPLRSAWPEDEVYKHNPVGHLNWKNKWREGAASEPGLFSISMIGSRGCPYAGRACDYCYAAYLGQTYRLRSPKDIVDEMEYCRNEFGAVYIHFLDDLLLTDYRWALEWFDELRKRREATGFEVQWGGTCRTNIIADDVIRARKEGRPHMLEQAYEVGMRQAGYGIESGSPTILKLIDKSGQTIEKMELAVAETKRVLGYADCSFMIGSPGETPDTVRETVEFCQRVGLKPEVFFFTTAYPGTAFWDLALEKGLIGKAVTGRKGPADEDMIEGYLIRLGEQGEEVRTNFSDLPDEEIVELSWGAINTLGAQNVVRHPHTGDEQPRADSIRGATRADL